MGSNGKVIHTNVLVKSDKSCLEGCLAVEDRFLTICDRYTKTWGVELVIPESLRPDFVRWRELVSRYNKGDYRHTEAELQSVKAIAQWTVDENCKLCGQSPVQIQW